MITLITRNDCQYCKISKEVLMENNMDFEEKIIGKDITREEVLLHFPEQKILPIVIANGKLLGGYVELLDYIYPMMGDKEDERTNE